MPPLPTAFPWRALAAGIALWAIPAALVLALAGRDSLYAQVYGFFTSAALVTFGGAYSVLAWVSQQAVEVHGWLTQAQTVTGLALAETTPGPLIIVLQFIGFMAGWNAPGTAGAAVTATRDGAADFLGDLPAVLHLHPGRRALCRAPDRDPAARWRARRHHGGGGRRDRKPRGNVRDGGVLSRRARRTAVAGDRDRGVALVLLLRTRIDVLWIIGGGALAGVLVNFLA